MGLRLYRSNLLWYNGLRERSVVPMLEWICNNRAYSWDGFMVYVDGETVGAATTRTGAISLSHITEYGQAWAIYGQ